MTTSPRRAEVCGLRWTHFEADRQRLTLRRNIVQDGTELWEKDTKTHQRRHIALDPETVAVLSDYKAHREKRAAQFGLEITPESFIFSLAPDGSEPLKPKTASQRYNRLADRLGIKTTLHRLRHYSATELIAAGVDIRTVAGRLGHSGGGTTTLKVYAAWVNEADQRASQTLLSRVPERPAPPLHPAERAKTNPQSPYEKIAAQLRPEILDGTRKPGEFAPTVKELQAANNVGAGTAHRALGLLKTWGLVEASRGQRAVVVEPPPSEMSTAGTATATNAPATSEHPNATGAMFLELRLLHMGKEARRFTAEADPQDPAQLRRLLSAAARRLGGTDVDLTDYELEVRRVGDAKLVTSFAVL